MTEIDSLANFQDKAQQEAPEMTICSVVPIIWDGTSSIRVNVLARPIARSLWANEKALKKAAKECGFSGFIVVMCEGRYCCAPIGIND